MSDGERTALIDVLRGELDKKLGADPGWSGPITKAYLEGYGDIPNEDEHLAVSTYNESLNHGWY